MIWSPAKLPTIAAYAYKKSVGQPFLYPDNKLTLVENFLRMTFGLPAEPYDVDPEIVKALDMLLILHADHEQNCSTSTVRNWWGRHRPTFSPRSAPASTRCGARCTAAPTRRCWRCSSRSGRATATSAVRPQGEEPRGRREADGLRHRGYKNYDPRVRIVKEQADKILGKLGGDDDLLNIAKELEEAALYDDYFIERKLYPNVDFYTEGIKHAQRAYRAQDKQDKLEEAAWAIGIPAVSAGVYWFAIRIGIINPVWTLGSLPTW